MIKMICWLVLSQFFIGITCSINIGYINSTEYIPTNFTDVSLYNGTCSECICFAFISNNSSNYKTINCYSNNNSCLLFKSSISSSNIRISNNSTIAILSSSINITEEPTVARYGQCGGMGWTGATKCSDGWSCVYLNAYYSQCLAGTNPSTTPASTSNSTTISFANMTRQNASTGLYWGCCKPSCGWPGKASVSSPVNTCQLDGNTTIDSNTQSICNSGSACMCTNQQPWNISSTLSYGFVGVGLIGETEWDWCCACYSLLFTSDLIAGKEIIVQVVDSLGNNNNMFVLQIPGGGWGYSSSVGCPSQYGGSYSWGNQYGGFTNRTQCDNLPIGLQPGCYWRFDWFMNAQYPDVSWKQVACPSILTAITGCVRN